MIQAWIGVDRRYRVRKSLLNRTRRDLLAWFAPIRQKFVYQYPNLGSLAKRRRAISLVRPEMRLTQFNIFWLPLGRFWWNFDEIISTFNFLQDEVTLIIPSLHTNPKLWEVDHVNMKKNWRFLFGSFRADFSILPLKGRPVKQLLDLW